MMEGTLAECFLSGSQEVGEGLKGFASSKEMGADALGTTGSVIDSFLEHPCAGQVDPAGSATHASPALQALPQHGVREGPPLPFRVSHDQTMSDQARDERGTGSHSESLRCRSPLSSIDLISQRSGHLQSLSGLVFLLIQESIDATVPDRVKIVGKLHFCTGLQDDSAGPSEEDPALDPVPDELYRE